jgi:hypothetical protein
MSDVLPASLGVLDCDPAPGRSAGRTRMKTVNVDSAASEEEIPREPVVGPILTLLVISPGIGEVLSGATRLNYIFALVPAGCGAPLARRLDEHAAHGAQPVHSRGVHHPADVARPAPMAGCNFRLRAPLGDAPRPSRVDAKSPLIRSSMGAPHPGRMRSSSRNAPPSHVSR